MMLIGERGVGLNLMQKWDMNKLYKVGLSKQTVPNELYCSKSGEKPLNIANLSSFSGVMRHFNL